MDAHGFYGYLAVSAVDSLRTPTVVTAGVTAPLKWVRLRRCGCGKRVQLVQLGLRIHDYLRMSKTWGYNNSGYNTNNNSGYMMVI